MEYSLEIMGADGDSSILVTSKDRRVVQSMLHSQAHEGMSLSLTMTSDDNEEIYRILGGHDASSVAKDKRRRKK